MQLSEPLGNPYGDVIFLQSVERHRGESRKKIELELRRAGVLETDKIKGEAEEFFDNVCSNGLRLPKEIKEVVKEDFKKWYKFYSDLKFTLFGRKTVKDSLKAYLLFGTLPKQVLPLYPCSGGDLKKLKEGREIFTKKLTKLLGGKCFSRLGWDRYIDLCIDFKKIRASFKTNLPDDVILSVWLDATPEVLKLIDEKIWALREERFKKRVKDVNGDYLWLLTRFYVIKKEEGKILKPLKELATIWNIPLRTLKRKMSFLKKIDV